MDTKLQQNIYSKMTPFQKWQEALRLREIAWLMKRAFIKEQNPNWSDVQIDSAVKKIFLYAST